MRLCRCLPLEDHYFWFASPALAQGRAFTFRLYQRMSCMMQRLPCTFLFPCILINAPMVLSGASTEHVAECLLRTAMEWHCLCTVKQILVSHEACPASECSCCRHPSAERSGWLAALLLQLQVLAQKNVHRCVARCVYRRLCTLKGKD